MAVWNCRRSRWFASRLPSNYTIKGLLADWTRCKYTYLGLHVYVKRKYRSKCTRKSGQIIKELRKITPNECWASKSVLIGLKKKRGLVVILAESNEIFIVHVWSSLKLEEAKYWYFNFSSIFQSKSSTFQVNNLPGCKAHGERGSRTKLLNQFYWNV